MNENVAREEPRPDEDSRPPARKNWRAWESWEVRLFYQYFPIYKANYKEYLKHLPNRTYSQVKSFYHNKKNRRCIAQSPSASLDEESSTENERTLEIDQIDDVQLEAIIQLLLAL